MGKFEAKPYDEKLSENLAKAIIEVLKKSISITLEQEKKIVEGIKELVDRQVVLYKDYDEDIHKAYYKARADLEERVNLVKDLLNNHADRIKMIEKRLDRIESIIFGESK